MSCSGDGLVIAADNVTIDLNNHTLSGTSSGTGVTMAGPSGMLNAPVVENGRITGFATGVKIGAHGVHDAALASVTFANDAAGGAALDVESGPMDGMQIGETTFDQSSGHAVLIKAPVTGQFLVTYSTFHGDISFTEPGDYNSAFVVKNNKFEGNGSGISLQDVENSTFEENHFLGSGGINDMCAHFGGDTFYDNTFAGPSFGIVATTMAHEKIDYNHFSDDFVGVQFVLGDGDNANEITNNDFHNEGDVGILLEDDAKTTTAVTVSGNIVENSGSTPHNLPPDPGGNRAIGGIHIYAPQGGVLVDGNTTTSNQGYGIWSIPGTATGTGNTSKGDQNGCTPTSLCTYN